MLLNKRPNIERFLARPSEDIHVALIYGRDRGVVRDRADRLAKAITEDPNDPFNVSLLTETDVDADPAKLADELSAQSLMGGRRLVRLKLTAEKASVDRTTAEAAKRHVENDFNPDAFLLIEAGALGRDSALRKTAERANGIATIPCYEDEPADIARLSRETLAKDGISLNTETLELFVSRLPKERGVARREIERLILYLGPGAGTLTTPSDLIPFFGVEPDASLTDAARDAFGGKLAAAHAGLKRAVAEGEGGPAIIRAMGTHLGRLRRTLTLAEAGASLPEAAKASGVFWRNEREFLRQASVWTLKHLNHLQPEVLEADRICKQTGSPDGLIAERLVLMIAGRARRLGL